MKNKNLSLLVIISVLFVIAVALFYYKNYVQQKAIDQFSLESLGVGWEGPLNKPSEFGTSTQQVQAQTEVLLSSRVALQTSWVGNKAYTRFYGVSGGGSSIDFNTVLRDEWGAPLDLSRMGLPSGVSGNVTGYDVTVSRQSDLIQTIFVGNRGFRRTMKYTLSEVSSGEGQNIVNFSNVSGWSELQGIPSGTVSAYSMYMHPSGVYHEQLVASKQFKESWYPALNNGQGLPNFNQPKFGKKYIYRGITTEGLPGGINLTAYSTTTLIDNEIFQSIWQGINKGYYRTVNVPAVPTNDPTIVANAPSFSPNSGTTFENSLNVKITSNQTAATIVWCDQPFTNGITCGGRGGTGQSEVQVSLTQSTTLFAYVNNRNVLSNTVSANFEKTVNGWSGPITKQGPGSSTNKVQAQSEVVLGSNGALQTVWVNNQAYNRIYEVTDNGGKINFSNVLVDYWDRPVSKASLGGAPASAAGSITAYDIVVSRNRDMVQTVFVGNRGFRRTMKYSLDLNRQPALQLTNVSGWAEIQGIPTGTVKGYSMWYHPDNVYHEQLVLGNRFLESWYPAVGGNGLPNYNNPKFNKTFLYRGITTAGLPGGTNIDAYTVTVLTGNKIFQSIWQGLAKGYYRTVTAPNVPTSDPSIVAKAPVFNPASGTTFTDSLSVNISTDQAGASVVWCNQPFDNGIVCRGEGGDGVGSATANISTTTTLYAYTITTNVFSPIVNATYTKETPDRYSVELDNITVNEGATRQITAAVLNNGNPISNSEYSNLTFDWEISSTNFATISPASGGRTATITGVNPGQTGVRVYVKRGGQELTRTTATVVVNEVTQDNYSIDFMDPYQNSVPLEVGETKEVFIKILNNGAEIPGGTYGDYTYEWVSANTNVATVAPSINCTGGTPCNQRAAQVTGISDGRAVIGITIKQGGQSLATKSITANVTQVISDSYDVSFDPSSLSVGVGQSQEVVANISKNGSPLPVSQYSDFGFNWASQDNNIATVLPQSENSRVADVTGVSEGESSISLEVILDGEQVVVGSLTSTVTETGQTYYVCSDSACVVDAVGNASYNVCNIDSDCNGDYNKYDVNRDNAVNISDVLVVIKYIFK